MKIIEKEYNVITGETTITEREETAQEQATRETLGAEFAAHQAKVEAQTEAKAELLAKLGITEEEAKLLLGGN